MFSVDHVQHGTVARMWDIRKALHALYKTEKQNFVTPVTAPCKIIHFGKRKCAKIWAAKPRLSVGRPSSRSWLSRIKGQPQKRSIETAKPQPVQTSKSRKPSNLMTGVFFEPKVIALTPDQLRPSAQIESGQTQSTKTNGAKPLKYERLYKIWRAMQMDHYNWNHLLVIADMMTTSRDFREEYAPL